MVHVVRLGAADRLEPAELLHHRDVFLDGRRDRVLRVQFGDTAVHALGRGPVVRQDVDDQGVVENAPRLEFVDQPAHLHIGVLEETGKHFHQPGLEGTFFLREFLPGGHRLLDAGARVALAGIQPISFCRFEDSLLA